MTNSLESDWKVYSKLIPVWRERYLQSKNDDLVAILSNDGKTPTERFWETKVRIDDEAKILDQFLGCHSRSKMWMSMLLMYRYGFILDEDLEQFSESLRRDIRGCSKVANRGVSG